MIYGSCPRGERRFLMIKNHSEKETLIMCTIGVKVLPKNRLEFEQTIEALIEDVRRMKGCLDNSLWRNTGNKNFFVLVSRWKGKKYILEYLQTDCFGVLAGAIQNLCAPQEVMISVTSSAKALSEVEEAYARILSFSVPVREQV
jgi:quinol monooxygenase YgiN